MKKLSFFAFVFFALSSIAVAQRQPWKFDEFTDRTMATYYPYAEMTLAARIERYKVALQKNRTAKPYIIYYKGRVFDNGNRYQTERWFETPRQELRQIRRFEDVDAVPEVFGGFREENTLQFWIVPKGASLPKPSPSVSRSETITCPGLGVYSSGFHFDLTKPVVFTASVPDKPDGLSYRWHVTGGEIVSGNDTNVISVDVSRSALDSVTASVKVEGLPLPCKSTALAFAEIGLRPHLFDYVENSNSSYLSAVLDSLMISVNNNPTLKAYVIGYSPRTGRLSGINSGLIDIRRSFAFRRYSNDRVIFVDGGSRDLASVEIWLVPPGADPPKPRPSVDSRFVKKSKIKLGDGSY